MKYLWPKVSIQPPLKMVACWVDYPLRIEGKFYINIGSTVHAEKGSVLGRLPFFKCMWPSLSSTCAKYQIIEEIRSNSPNLAGTSRGKNDKISNK